MRTHTPHIARRRWLTLTALLVTAFPLGWSHSTRADVVTDWSAIAQTAIVTNAGRPPSGTIIDVAYVFAAMYDAVNAIDGRYTAFAVSVSRIADRFAGRRGGRRRPPRPEDVLPDPTGVPRRRSCGLDGRDSPRPRPGSRQRRRSTGGHGIPGAARQRWPQRRRSLRLWQRSRRVPTDARCPAAARFARYPMGGADAAVCTAEPLAVPRRGPAESHERTVGRGPQ